MSDPAWQCICEPEQAIALLGDDFSASSESAATSPIDDYYAYAEHLLTLGSEKALTDSPTLGRLLLLGQVSGVESYFRSVIAGVLRICPIARRAAADHTIPLGALDYYGLEHVELGLFDAASLASAAEVRKRTQGLLGISVTQGTSLWAALDEFDKICHLRHAAVHARGSLGRGNASALALGSSGGRKALVVKFSTLQHAGLVCHSAVRAYNRAVFRGLIERWIGAGLISSKWESDKPIFKPLFDLFASKTDGTAPANAYQAHRSVAQTLSG